MRYRRVQAPGAQYLFTVVTETRAPIFGKPANVALLQEAIALVQSRHSFDIDAFVILPDHLHAIWSLPEQDSDYAMRWRLIKDRFTRSYLRSSPAPVRTASRQMKREQAVWQRRFWEHTIRDDADFIAHTEYIHFNPVRHGLVKTLADWPHSSFADWVARGIYDRDWGSDAVPEFPILAIRSE